MNNDDSYAEFIVSRDRLTEPSPSVDPADALGEQSLMGSPMPKDTNVFPDGTSGVEDYTMDALGQNSLTGREVDLPFAPEMPQQTDVGLASTIGTNLKALPGAVARGGAAAIYETMFSAGQLTETQVQQMRDMDKKFNEDAVQRGANEMVVSGAQGLAQFGVGMFPAFKALRLAGLGRPAAALISEGLTGAFAFNPDDPNIGNFVQSLKPESPVIQNMANFIATDPNDTVAENRFRNALQDTIPSGIIEGIIKVVKGVRGLDAKTLIKKGEEAEARLNNLGNTLSANPVGPVADMAVAGVGKVAGAMQPQKPAPVFYSAVANAVDALPMEKGGGDQMRAMIAKSAEVKPEEMAWIGLDDFLKGKKSVTKQEIQDYVDANQVQIEEVVRAELVQFGPDTNPELSIPGGENYREVLLRLPDMQGRNISDAELKRLIELTDKRVEIGLDGLIDAERNEYLSLVSLREDKGQFRGGHFDEPNVLAHVRLNDRTGPNGEKILFVEEFQSDWHQKGQKQGYKTPTGKLSAEKIDPKFGEGWAIKDKNGQQIIIINNPTTVALADGNLEYKNITNSEEAIKAAQEQLDNPNRYGAIKDNLNKRVPDAPLKKTWQEMSFRRVARMAAAEGYDAIAWTPGKMQAERYDLSKQISEIDYDPDTKKLTAYEKDGYSPVINEIVSEDKLADYIGKDVTEKLLATTRKTIPTDKGNTSQHSLKGADLQVGGKFHKDLYDKKIKQYADKWGKKFGSKVGVTDLNTGRRVEATGKTMEQVWTMPVTKKMKDSVLRKGVATFGASGLAIGMNKEAQNGN